MSNFITNNDEKSLKKRLVELAKRGKELKFLIGFFYFSGIRELYEGLKDNKNVNIKVLVGLNVDKTAFGLHELAHGTNLSDEEKVYKFFESIKKSLNSEDFDTKEFYEQVRFFIKLIEDNRLTIRKTFEPNHAKLYIFKLEEEQVGRKEIFVTGSSNLTRAGLTTQQEFNVEISDFGFENAEEYFDSLWAEAVKITEDNAIKSKLINVIEKETLIKETSPFEAFVLILKTYLDSFDQRKEIGQSLIDTLEKYGYVPYQYQLDAVKQALSIIEKNNGVILADVVGLGKTIIACAVAKSLRKRGLVICPPGLVGDKNKTSGWLKYTEEFGLYDWEVRSLGDLEGGKLSEFVNKAKDIEVVIIDEAHRFRNQDTEDYESLKNICRNKIVILLTATPFNNRPGDILSLLKLFITPKKSSITLENNLVDKFRTFKGMFDRLAYIKKYHNSPNDLKRKKAESYYESIFGEKGINLERIKQRAHYLARQIRDVIEPVTIRRNRLDLQNNPYYKDEVENLSKFGDPKEWFYELSKEQSEFYDRIITYYFGDPEDGGIFQGAIYRPFEYEIKREKIESDNLTQEENRQFQQQRNLYDFMRRLIVKRFESSFGSFEQSIKNFKRITENALSFIEKTNKYILDRSLLERIFELDEEEIEKQLVEFEKRLNSGNFPKNNRIYNLDKFAYRDDFISHIKSDLTIYHEILEELSKLDLVNNDPKADLLVERVKEELSKKPQNKEPKRKIVIFSEYVDTINHLVPILGKHFGAKLLTVAGDLSNQKILEINRNFDASVEKQENDYEILLSTDRLSEGFNLNRAGLVINYDIPWNPVRVIQRVGRINRISKKVFDNLYIVNFFPTEKGSELVKSREIASNKMFLIHSTLGEDAKIFDVDEEPTPAGLFERVQQNPDKLEEESFYTKALRIFLVIRKEDPELVAQLKYFPPRIKVAKKSKENELLVFLKKDRLYVYAVRYGSDKEQIRESTFEDVFDYISCDKSEKGLTLSDSFWEYYEQIKEYKSNTSSPVNEQSLEQKALNNLQTLITKPWPGLMPHLDFLRILREDILDYGTLSDYTLRRILNLEFSSDDVKKRTLSELIKLKDELGDDYLEKEKQRQKELKKEIIVAVENQKSE